MISCYRFQVRAFFISFLSILLLADCTEGNTNRVTINMLKRDPSSKILPYSMQSVINTGKTTPAELVAFARSLYGIPYLYASSDPDKGFDCSGFITYVFNHFGIAVPRSSVDFTLVGKEVRAANAKPGDLILFTGTDSSIKTVGHMGIITSLTSDNVRFIHATSGRANGVTETSLSPNYLPRLVKIIRIFP